jgi:hydrogenase maturation protease
MPPLSNSWVGEFFKVNNIMKRALIFGFGNADRQDDGVAWHILVGLAQKMNFSTPSEPGDQFTSSNDQVVLQFNLQLTPELAETINNFDVVYFVDAHTGAIKEDISFQSLIPQTQTSPFTHHLSPQMLLSITQTIYGIVPRAFLLSIRAFEFEFSRDLSQRTQNLCTKAIELLWNHLIEVASLN